MRLTQLLRSASTSKFAGGAGSRHENNKLPQGLTLSSLKHHVALQPLFIIMGAGIIFVGAYIIRLATKTTDVNWSKNEEPWNYYHSKQFKFLNPSGADYTQLGKDIPNYKEAK